MLEAGINEQINAQINKEFYSAYLYLAFSNHFEKVGLHGFASWYKIQAREECDHAMIFVDYLNSENAPVILERINSPEVNEKDTKAILKNGLAHEKYITCHIEKLYKKAAEIEDFRTMNFLEWFIREQAEEEHQAEELLTKIKLYGEDLASIYMMDKDLMKRKYEEPSFCS